ncbi:hypothetical protein A2V71_00100 [Candidatus Berkelbacteria bacterium RBG_13_40_8]|uniref:Uncharacterized protein n=1 Tax=Candidatus Berkelbacteria bacterium RBG_13_40_8 TaxID=1797467 RepID=A0A1F5DLW3_9BACT|nr:MAG: hypothetical protein A2V71_00100 [Candidatus Berkelbacteria bacterium RBG_13_40_8]
MKNNNIDDDYEKIEEELKEKESEEKSASRRTHHKVSGKSVFELQEIIKKKANTKRPDRKENQS